MHGQYDWMNDPALYSQTYEWDNQCDADSWRKTHNYEHHAYTNIIGMDRDYGYGILRLSDDTPWKLRHVFNVVTFGLLSTFFQIGVGLHELEIENIANGKVAVKEKVPFLKRFLKKVKGQMIKDYIFFPLLAGPMAIKVVVANLLANFIRNLWSASVIFCGHFTKDTQTFHDVDYEKETRGEWYYRQALGCGDRRGDHAGDARQRGLIDRGCRIEPHRGQPGRSPDQRRAGQQAFHVGEARILIGAPRIADCGLAGQQPRKLE